MINLTHYRPSEFIGTLTYNVPAPLSKPDQSAFNWFCSTYSYREKNRCVPIGVTADSVNPQKYNVLVKTELDPRVNTAFKYIVLTTLKVMSVYTLIVPLIVKIYNTVNYRPAPLMYVDPVILTSPINPANPPTEAIAAIHSLRLSEQCVKCLNELKDDELVNSYFAFLAARPGDLREFIFDRTFVNLNDDKFAVLVAQIKRYNPDYLLVLTQELRTDAFKATEMARIHKGKPTWHFQTYQAAWETCQPPTNPTAVRKICALLDTSLIIKRLPDEAITQCLSRWSVENFKQFLNHAPHETQVKFSATILDSYANDKDNFLLWMENCRRLRDANPDMFASLPNDRSKKAFSYCDSWYPERRDLVLAAIQTPRSHQIGDLMPLCLRVMYEGDQEDMEHLAIHLLENLPTNYRELPLLLLHLIDIPQVDAQTLFVEAAKKVNVSIDQDFALVRALKKELAPEAPNIDKLLEMIKKIYPNT